VFENGVQWRIFGPKNDTVYWDNLCAGVLHDLCRSLSAIQLIKTRKMRWTGHVALNGGGVMCAGFWW
jgi:hypothetical protein